MSDFSYSPYYTTAIAAANRYGIPTDLFTAQIGQESSFNPNAINGNAQGIAQFMPGTAKDFGINPLDPGASLDAAAKYDSQLYNQYGSWQTAMQKYGTTAGGAGAAVDAIAQQYDLFGQGHARASEDGASSVPKSVWGSIGDFFSFITDIPRVITILFGIIMVIAGLYMLGNKQAIALVEAAKP